MRVAVAACVLSLLTPFAAVAQDVEPVPAVKNLERIVGHWVNEEQQRDSPDGSWQEVASEWTINFTPGGFFVETPGEMRFKDGRVDSWVQVWGHDPIEGSDFNMWFNSTGGRGEQEFTWDGSTLVVNGTTILADGTTFKIRCTWEHSSNFTKSDGVCERLSDNAWWAFRKVKGTKTE
jgi:hypothetical protein